MKKNIMLIPAFTLGIGLCLSTYSFKLQKLEPTKLEENTSIKEEASIISIIKKINERITENKTIESNLKDSEEKNVEAQKTVEQESAQAPNQSNGISTTKKEPVVVREKFGTLGRLYLPTINHSVAVYYANVYNNTSYNAQKIVDDEDSAAYYQLGNKYIVADHYYQGFKKIVNLNVGDTASIKMNDGTVKNYYLKNKLIGINASADLTDEAGNSIQTMDGTLVMYTCYTSDKKIMITLWDEII